MSFRVALLLSALSKLPSILLIDLSRSFLSGSPVPSVTCVMLPGLSFPPETLGFTAPFGLVCSPSSVLWLNEVIKFMGSPARRALGIISRFSTSEVPILGSFQDPVFSGESDEAAFNLIEGKAQVLHNSDRW